ncbi:hypothetical protein [Mucilaginibacter myungsuensis]|uniref:Uncharacterized protein n=1 Tax=Mucilaginibacter myungsuensis TaxID=649104 RepID=A0A929L0K2_9SPHI|nr:hypothetical protein [Mucilaginibacter myungsuensis]MBE9662294.1 hypothetical protein [Mucilaginibacter myungsuensis]MDN3599269.1 hypothetical protein [Mucilaginibacter myungsuensis]
MDPSARAAFNANFTDEKYQQFLTDIKAGVDHPIHFRLAETPIFISDDFYAKLQQAGADVIGTILQPDFKELTERAIPDQWRVAKENGHAHMIALDFGVCKDDNGDLVPKLIELQGFPSLYGFQSYASEHYKKSFDIAEEWTGHLNGLDEVSYIELLKKTIIGPHQPDEVVLMDVNAPEQKTSVDFYITQQYLGIPVVSLEGLVQKGDQLYYPADGQLKPIKRIYNRLIFDEIAGDPDIFNKAVDIRKPLNVEWLPHPNWFYRISKFTMPFFKGDFVPKTQFLHQVNPIPADLESYVLKPLFSFAGQGVIIDVKPEDISAIKDPENWILQEKVNYEPAIQSPDGGVKAEIRLLYLWPDGDAEPTLAITLARLSRGKMIGVRYNKDFDWVGGTVALVRK